MKHLVFLSFLFLSLLANAQSGWVKPKGKVYAQLSYAAFSSNKYYNISGELSNSKVIFSQQSLLAYAEYGLGKRFGVVANYVAYRWNGFETTETVSGGGDAFVGVQYGILTKNFPLSILVGPEIPIGKSDLYARNKESVFDDFINLPTGDGEWNVWTTLALSHSFPKLRSYFTLTGGYNFRTKYREDQFSDQFKVGLELGFQPINKVWIQGKARIYQTVGEPNSGVDFTRGEGTAFTSFGVSASYNFWKNFVITGSSAFYSDLIVQRQNLYSAPSYLIGIALDIK